MLKARSFLLFIIYVDNCEKLFELLDSFGEANRRKVQYVWPLQMMLLVLCPIILEDLV